MKSYLSLHSIPILSISDNFLTRLIFIQHPKAVPDYSASQDGSRLFSIPRWFQIIQHPKMVPDYSASQHGSRFFSIPTRFQIIQHPNLVPDFSASQIFQSKVDQLQQIPFILSLISNPSPSLKEHL
jgi:hypothetical protein